MESGRGKGRERGRRKGMEGNENPVSDHDDLLSPDQHLSLVSTKYRDSQTYWILTNL